MPERQVNCDPSHFWCDITLHGAHQLYGKDGKPIRDVERGEKGHETEILASLDSWRFRSELTTIFLDLKLPTPYLTISNLPFHALLLPPSQ